MEVHARRGPGRPVGGKPVIDRESLLDAAERVIARDGSGASLEAIAAEAGVSKPIVYARIGRREELCDALATRFVDRLVTAATREVRSDVPSRAEFIGFFRATFETMAAHRSLFVYVNRGGDDAADRTLRSAQRSAEPLAQFLERWRIAVGADPATALPWAYGIIGMVNLVVLWWLESGDGTADVLAEQLVDLLWSGLNASP